MATCLSVKRSLSDQEDTQSSTSTKRLKTSHKKISSENECMNTSPETASPLGEVVLTMAPENMVATIHEEDPHIRLSQNSTDQTQLASTTKLLNEELRFTPYFIDENDKELFTDHEVALVCQKKMREQAARLKEEYEDQLKCKSSEQYETFIKFTQDQLNTNIDRNGSYQTYLS